MTRPKAYVLAHRVADAGVPQARRLFLAAIRATRRAVQPWQTPAEVQRDIERVMHRMYEPIKDILRGLLARSAKALAKELHLPVKKQETLWSVGFRFDLSNPHAVSWVNRHGADLVLGITNESKKALRAILTRAELGGYTPQEAARLIRGYVGLTSQQAQAAFTYEDGLRKAGLTPSKVERAAEAYRNRLLNQRAETIARTETMTAANRGQEEVWREATQEGYLDPASRRIWIITPDERLCPLCEPVPDMNPEGVGLEEPFQTPDGPIQGPPLHPSCRCTEGLTFP